MSKAAFIKEVTAKLIAEQADFSNSMVLLPTRRAVFMFREELQNQLKNTGFLPRILAIEDFAEQITGFRTLKGEELIPEAYPVYKSVFTNRAADFSSYLNSIHMLLADLNDIDSYLLEVGQLFAYLRDERALKLWNPSGEELTDFQKNYLDFWQKMEPFYKALTEKFNQLKGGYRGYVYKMATLDTVAKINNRFPEITRIDWVGFNNFNACEHEIFKQLQNDFTTCMHVSIDDYYYKNPGHEAGRFVRELVNKYAKKIKLYNAAGFGLPDKEITVHAAPGEYAMAKLAGSLIQEADSNQKTALILADEGLLMPVLSSLPPSVKEVNVTMGIPVNKSRYYGFLQLLFKIRVLARRDFKKRIHVVSLIEFLKHPGADLLPVENTSAVTVNLLNSQKAYLSAEELKTMVSCKVTLELLDVSEAGRDSQLQFLNLILEQFIEFRRKRKREGGESTDLFMLDGVLDVLSSAAHFMKKYDVVKTPEEFEKFWRLIAPGLTVPLKGDKSDFLQVMGILESRVLDFDRIIVTSVNEGVIPGGRKGVSLIPHQIKAKFGLPDYAAGDAVFAYHFYRMLQYPSKIDLVYDSSSSEMSHSEPSRFIRQLEIDWNHKAGGNFKHIVHNFPRQKVLNTLPEIEKTPVIIRQIEDYLSRVGYGLSASALNTYLNSPLDFYLKYIVGIREPDELEEHIEDSTFGTVVHEVLEALFFQYDSESLLLTSEDIERLLPRVKEALNEKFSLHYKGGFQTGSNFLMHKVAYEMIRRFLKVQSTEIKQGESFYVLSQETKETYDLKVNGVNCCVNGKADRIDRFDGFVRVVDYKTGKVEPKNLNIKSIEVLFDKKHAADKSKARQVLFYAWVVSKRLKGVDFTSGIYSMKNLKAGFIPLRIDLSTTISQEHLEAFEFHLKQVLEEMLNPEIPFSQPVAAKYTLFE